MMWYDVQRIQCMNAHQLAFLMNFCHPVHNRALESQDLSTAMLLCTAAWPGSDTQNLSLWATHGICSRAMLNKTLAFTVKVQLGMTFPQPHCASNLLCHKKMQANTSRQCSVAFSSCHESWTECCPFWALSQGQEAQSMSIYLYPSHAKGLHPAMSQTSQLYSGTRGTVIPERDCSEDILVALLQAHATLRETWAPGAWQLNLRVRKGLRPKQNCMKLLDSTKLLGSTLNSEIIQPEG